MMNSPSSSDGKVEFVSTKQTVLLQVYEEVVKVGWLDWKAYIFKVYALHYQLLGTKKQVIYRKNTVQR